MKKFKLAKR